jgi:hypothetical protein
MGTGSFPGVKWPGRGVEHPPPPRVEVKERVQLYLYSTSGPSWPVIGCTLPLLYCHDSFFTVPIVILTTCSLSILLDLWNTECLLYMKLGGPQSPCGRFWRTVHILDITYEILTVRQ